MRENEAGYIDPHGTVKMKPLVATTVTYGRTAADEIRELRDKLAIARAALEKIGDSTMDSHAQLVAREGLEKSK